jgi:outer membrane biogenesis lipoprotein LolB
MAKHLTASFGWQTTPKRVRLRIKLIFTSGRLFFCASRGDDLNFLSHAKEFLPYALVLL